MITSPHDVCVYRVATVDVDFRKDPDRHSGTTHCYSMTHRTFRELGNYLADEWGYDDGGELETQIKTMPSERRMYCLLAAVVGQLRDMHREISNLRYSMNRLPEPPQEAEPRDVVADGMLKWMCVSMGDKLVSEMDDSQLSPRARKALRRANVLMLSQITAERFEGIKYCGQVTINEIVEWAKTIEVNRRSDG